MTMMEDFGAFESAIADAEMKLQRLDEDSKVVAENLSRFAESFAHPMKASRSQSHEDRILGRLFREIGVTNRVAVEFGAYDGEYCSNTARLRKQGWTCVLFDAIARSPLVQEVRITSDNVNMVFEQAGVPQRFDLLSIDIDGNDFWVWQALTFQPRVVVIEYNPKFTADVSCTVPDDPDRVWDSTDYYGASVRALWRLGRRKGYRLVRATKANLLFVVSNEAQRQMRPEHAPIPRYQKRPDPLERPWQVYR